MNSQYQDLSGGSIEWFQSLSPDLLFEQQSKSSLQQHLKSSLSKQNPQSKRSEQTSYIQSYQNNLKNLLDAYGESSELKRYSFPKSCHFIGDKEQKKPQKGKRSRKTQKAWQYSRNYRQKKKEHLKTLEQDNKFLKMKVDDLQMRLNEKQMELNRIKFAAKNQDYDIKKLNEQMTKKLTLIADQKIQDVQETKQQKQEKKLEFIEENKKMSQFLKFFDVYGVGGVKSKQILEYYINEFLQNVMRDREKYYYLKCIKRESLKQYKTPLDFALQQVTEQTTQEQDKNIMKYYSDLYPILDRVKDACQQFYRDSQKLISLLEKTHQVLRYQYQQNLELTKKRLKTILWFQQNQYHKQMRNLRAEWIATIKCENQYDEEITQEKIKKKKHN